MNSENGESSLGAAPTHNLNDAQFHQAQAANQTIGLPIPDGTFTISSGLSQSQPTPMHNVASDAAAISVLPTVVTAAQNVTNGQGSAANHNLNNAQFHQAQAANQTIGLRNPDGTFTISPGLFQPQPTPMHNVASDAAAISVLPTVVTAAQNVTNGQGSAANHNLNNAQFHQAQAANQTIGLPNPDGTLTISSGLSQPQPTPMHNVASDAAAINVLPTVVTTAQNVTNGQGSPILAGSLGNLNNYVIPAQPNQNIPINTLNGIYFPSALPQTFQIAGNQDILSSTGLPIPRAQGAVQGCTSVQNGGLLAVPHSMPAQHSTIQGTAGLSTPENRMTSAYVPVVMSGGERMFIKFNVPIASLQGVPGANILQSQWQPSTEAPPSPMVPQRASQMGSIVQVPTLIPGVPGANILQLQRQPSTEAPPSPMVPQTTSINSIAQVPTLIPGVPGVNILHSNRQPSTEAPPSPMVPQTTSINSIAQGPVSKKEKPQERVKVANKSESPARKKRGSPRKKVPEMLRPVSKEEETEEPQEMPVAPSPAKKKRGRPKKQVPEKMECDSTNELGELKKTSKLMMEEKTCSAIKGRLRPRKNVPGKLNLIQEKGVSAQDAAPSEAAGPDTGQDVKAQFHQTMEFRKEDGTIPPLKGLFQAQAIPLDHNVASAATPIKGLPTAATAAENVTKGQVRPDGAKIEDGSPGNITDSPGNITDLPGNITDTPGNTTDSSTPTKQIEYLETGKIYSFTDLPQTFQVKGSPAILSRTGQWTVKTQDLQHNKVKFIPLLMPIRTAEGKTKYIINNVPLKIVHSVPGGNVEQSQQQTKRDNGPRGVFHLGPEWTIQGVPGAYYLQSRRQPSTETPPSPMEPQITSICPITQVTTIIPGIPGANILQFQRPDAAITPTPMVPQIASQMGSTAQVTTIIPGIPGANILQFQRPDAAITPTPMVPQIASQMGSTAQVPTLIPGVPGANILQFQRPNAAITPTPMVPQIASMGSIAQVPTLIPGVPGVNILHSNRQPSTEAPPSPMVPQTTSINSIAQVPTQIPGVPGAIILQLQRQPSTKAPPPPMVPQTTSMGSIAQSPKNGENSV